MIDETLRALYRTFAAQLMERFVDQLDDTGRREEAAEVHRMKNRLREIANAEVQR